MSCLCERRDPVRGANAKVYGATAAPVAPVSRVFTQRVVVAVRSGCFLVTCHCQALAIVLVVASC